MPETVPARRERDDKSQPVSPGRHLRPWDLVSLFSYLTGCAIASLIGTMWIVRLALRRPYTFIVMSLLIAILGAISIVTMPTDIFPYINIPVVGVIWSYTGMSPDDMAKRVLTLSERAMTTTVSNIEHIESTAYNGVGLIRVYLQPGASVDLAISQIVAINQTILRTMPPGIFPPNVVQYDASSVPILQLGLSGNTLTEQQLFDYGNNFIRTRLSTVQGIAVPLPYGGKVRSVMVDLDPDALYGKGLSATDVSNALSLQNLILPTGTAKIGTREYLIQLNSSPELVTALNDVPLKTVNGAPIYMRDVAQVRDGYSVQTNIVRTDGNRSALLTVLKHGSASTLSVLNGAQQIAVPAFVSTLSICIVFVPVLMLSGAAKFLFTPLAMAVVFAMLTSYFLTRTVVPTLVHYLLPAEMALYQEGENRAAAQAAGVIWRIHEAFD